MKAILALALGIGAAAVAVADQQRPIIIGHRGASGHRPEHTLASYELAVQQGADYVEPDLVLTKDGVLLARHENEIGGTTDVEAKFPHRKGTKRVDGADITGWFTEDFTLAEIKTLRARERLPFRSKAHDGQFEVPTFEEVIALAARLSSERGRPVGLYPETKHPSYFRSIGLPLEEPLVAALERHGLNRADAPVFIQSFEVGNLKTLRTLTAVPLIQLMSESGRPYDSSINGESRSYADMASPAGLREIATYAKGIGANQRLILPASKDGTLLPSTTIIADAHAAGLLVHVWTLRSEPLFLSPSYKGDPRVEFRQFADLGVDGIFTDFPDVGVEALRR